LNENEDNKTLSDRKNTHIFSEAELQIGRKKTNLIKLVENLLWKTKNIF